MYYEDELLEMQAMVERRLDAEGWSVPNVRERIVSAILKRYLNELIEMGGGCTEDEAYRLTRTIIRDAEKS